MNEKIAREGIALVRQMGRRLLATTATFWTIEDLMDAAMVDLTLLISSYDPQIGSFRSFAGPRIYGAMLDAVRTETRRFHLLQQSMSQVGTVEIFEEKVDLERALGRLDPRTLDMVVRVHGAGFEVQEAGKAWGVSKSQACRVIKNGISLAQNALQEAA